jgi:hypothetical protein
VEAQVSSGAATRQRDDATPETPVLEPMTSVPGAQLDREICRTASQGVAPRSHQMASILASMDGLCVGGKTGRVASPRPVVG